MYQQKQSLRSGPLSTNYTTLAGISQVTSESSLPDDYEDITIVKLLNTAKFPVFLAFLPLKKKYLALKVFNFENDKPHPCFQNELRFAGLSHPNIIDTLCADKQINFSFHSQDEMVSCLLMEYAPYGDLTYFIQQLGPHFTDKLARTFFRHLIQGLEYLHNNDVLHLDLKPGNILLGNDYQIKVADFDMSYFIGDSQVLTKGSKHHRAPELIAGRDDVSASTDIYAAGILLFMMKCRGVLPYTEDICYRGVDLLELLNDDEDIEEFFETHAVIQEKELTFFDEDFKKLFIAMTRPEPEKRITIEGIKKSKWYNRPVYSEKELKGKLKQFFEPL